MSRHVSLSVTMVNLRLANHSSNVARLNITAATRVYILEPLWNPSMEKQAIGRAWRLGQNDKVTVVRYIVSGSIEEVCLICSLLS